jgi:hypothetical protein
MKLASICLCCRNVLLLGRIFTASGKLDKVDRRMDDKAVDDISLLANGQKILESEVDKLKGAHKTKDIELAEAAKKNAELQERLIKLEAKIAELEAVAQKKASN